MPNCVENLEHHLLETHSKVDFEIDFELALGRLQANFGFIFDQLRTGFALLLCRTEGGG